MSANEKVESDIEKEDGENIKIDKEHSRACRDGNE